MMSAVQAKRTTPPHCALPRVRSLVLGTCLCLTLTLQSGRSMALTAKEMETHCHELTAHAKSAGEDQLDIPNTPGALLCYGFFSAVQRFTVFQKEGERRRIFGICAPPETTLLQLIEVFE